MYLRDAGRRFTQMNAYFLVMNSKRCNSETDVYGYNPALFWAIIKKLYDSKVVKENPLESEGKSCRPENNNHSQPICVSWPLSVKHAAKITFAQYKCRTFQSIIYPADKNNFIGLSSILAWGKSRLGLPPPFIAMILLKTMKRSLLDISGVLAKRNFV